MTIRFPEHPLSEVAQYADEYFSTLASGAARIDRKRLAASAELIEGTVSAGGTIYAFGNGGSGAIANHLLCDFSKGIQTDTGLRPKVVSLASHTELILAIGNDIDFADIFLYQVRTWARQGDLLLAISSSGNSENIVRALQWGREAGVRSIALTGFDGGRAADLADIAIHVPVHNYGIVEDVHQAIMHTLAQFIRYRNMPSGLRLTRSF